MTKATPPDLSAILPWLQEARWFASKHSASVREHVTVVDALAIQYDPQRVPTHWIFFLAYGEQSSTSHYIVPVRCDLNAGRSAQCVDAATDPVFAAWLLGLIASEGSQPTAAGLLCGRRTAAANSLTFEPGGTSLDVCSIGGDASNTTLIVREHEQTDRSDVMKLIRRFRPGIQPEVEVANFLMQNGWGGSPELLGWLEYQPANDAGSSGVVATVHRGLSAAKSLWDHLLASLLDETTSSAEVDAVVEAAGTLTANMHKALACQSDSPDSAFAAVCPTPAVIAALEETMQAHARSVFSELETTGVSGSVQSRIRNLLTSRETLLKRFAALKETPCEAAFIRVHGDYHLGQLLYQPHSEKLWVIDFEGEPSRTLAERRERASVWKDLAGICRSFDYLARCASRQTHQFAIDSSRLSRLFLTAYARQAAGAAFWPHCETEARSLCTAFILDKAIYELAYELHNRPDWIEVPLAALEQILLDGEGVPPCFPPEENPSQTEGL